MVFTNSLSSYYEKFLATGEVKCIDEEIPFEIPATWEWCRLGYIFSHCTGKALNGTNRKGNLYTYITTSNLYWDRFELSSLKEMYFTEEELGKCTATKGDLLVCEGGDIGRSAIWNYDYNIRIQNHIHKLRSYIPLCTRFFYYVMYLYKGIGYIGGKGIGIQGLSSGALHNILIPTPSINEQKRIISQIEAIMPIAVKYEKSQEELNQLNDSIHNRLRKSILQEAIQGKLVPQIPEERTAQELLEQIRQEKQKLVKEGKLKKFALSDSVIYKGDDNKYYEQVGKSDKEITEEIAFDLPNGWSWCRLKDICSIFTGATFKKEETVTTKEGVRILRGGNISPFELRIKDDDIFLTKDKVKEDIILKENDILTPAVTSLENIGKMVRVNSDMPNTTVGGFVFIIRLYLKNQWLSKYILYLLSSPFMIDFMKSITNKSGQAFYNIGKERLSTALLPIPSLAEQHRIVAQIEKLFEQLR
ncbi:restriction endonuclease subunit S [Bacteroides fragilis]|jgi:restriction endonuclease, S subunit|uniref:Restriction endonuclease subunit S n=2 Tax=Bacteroides TaxID=816 RepID=A0A414Z489_9BACE|nr:MULTISPECIES: restriction endonuclease subunit S [Bacteroidales]KAA3823620.1 restriction endonuclease subunit S [Bacteroides ovatus]KAB4321951.1 restriction endonuclease subunit S [Bacteroides thetaiotaomicron]KAA3889908.1 restriction endonuclease subunit S [Bacteroides ovatus]KAB4331548.1 restriction endonuclease subunit S [Bacteroides thetaiotaomicron]KAB4363789.1 restriction endonuclease subunit S [Bacteroides thetaiotaomicron]